MTRTLKATQLGEGVVVLPARVTDWRTFGPKFGAEIYGTSQNYFLPSKGNWLPPILVQGLYPNCHCRAGLVDLLYSQFIPFLLNSTAFEMINAVDDSAAL